MADVGIYCKNANIQARAGANANATAKATTATDVYVWDVEALINVMTRYNWSDGYAGLNADVQYILMDCASSLCAMFVIQYDMSGFSSLQEATTMLDFLYNRFMTDIKILEDVKARDFMVGA